MHTPPPFQSWRVHSSKTLERLREEHDYATDPSLRQALGRYITDVEPIVELLDDLTDCLKRPVRASANDVGSMHSTLGSVYESVASSGDEIVLLATRRDDADVDAIIDTVSLASAELASFEGEVRCARDAFAESSALRRGLDALATTITCSHDARRRVAA